MKINVGKRNFFCSAGSTARAKALALVLAPRNVKLVMYRHFDDSCVVC